MLSTTLTNRPTQPIHGFPRWYATTSTVAPGVPHHTPLATDLGRVDVTWALNGVARRTFTLTSDMSTSRLLAGVTTRTDAIAAAQQLVASTRNPAALAVLQAAAGSWMVQRVTADAAALDAFTRPAGQGGLASVRLVATTSALAAIVGRGGVYEPAARQQR